VSTIGRARTNGVTVISKKNPEKIIGEPRRTFRFFGKYDKDRDVANTVTRLSDQLAKIASLFFPDEIEDNRK